MSTHTIGEVLNRLKDEFEDITISKIRFLEAEGLISPDRTESGYRKFTPTDIERLRYVLRSQRDRYLPLKVIKEELDRRDAGLLPAQPPDGDDDAQPPVAPITDEVPLGDAPGAIRLSAAELTQATGLDDSQLSELSYHGLLGDGPYDGDDVRIATVAAQLLRAGLEVRHLRMYKQFADRESTFAEAWIAPMLRQRNPDSRRAATEHAETLAGAGVGLHRALLVRQLRALLHP